MGDPHALLWRRLDVPGLEHFRLRSGPEEVRLAGVVIALLDGLPLYARYEVVCSSDWETRAAHVAVEHGPAARTLELRADESGRWELDGRHVTALDGLRDVDLGITPATNTLPIRRLDLAVGDSANVTAAWVRFPDLEVQPLPQSYTRVAERRYLYESAGGRFRAELEVDERGLVARYGDYWERLP